ncbi:MFS transporter [Haloarculaceae archaeon H-GB2-1]|nr:MFS transporter [Haloarculaceae archaeon H-GB1-1]MEA5389197.1 MFS transporter [Haloarculaceae archaeon H-GB11]MEA5409689.1 MFS transporter [Haloarculaceae archaeon H-GB2-1]
MSDGQETVGEVVDRIPVGRFHWMLIATMGGFWAAQGVAVLGISFVLPTLIDVWNLSGFTAGVLGSASLFGMIVGNTLGGRYADQFGRKGTMIATIVMFSVFTAATALATGLYSAVAFRFLTGIGLGGSLVAGVSYLTEYLPTDSRGRFITLLEAFFSVGSLVTVVLAWVVFSKLGADGAILGVAPWRVFFALGLFPVIFAVVVYYMPESPYYLAESGKMDAAASGLASLASSNDGDPESIPSELAVSDTPDVGFRRLFDGDLRGTTILMTSLWFGLNLAYYGIFTWLPNTVEAAGYVGSLYRYLFVVAVFQLTGQLLAAYLIEAIGRKWTLGIYLLLSGGATFLFAAVISSGTSVSGNELLFRVGLYAMGFALFGAWAVLYAYTSEIFPTKVRSTGLGFTGSIGKVAATAGPIVFGTLAEFGYLVALAPVATLLFVIGIALITFGRETRGETLT